MKKVYQGWVNECTFGFVTLHEDKTNNYSESLADQVSADWKKGDIVAVRYYVADKPMTEEEAVSMLIAKIYGGEINANYILDAYSEWTVLEWEEDLVIGCLLYTSPSPRD